MLHTTLHRRHRGNGTLVDNGSKGLAPQKVWCQWSLGQAGGGRGWSRAGTTLRLLLTCRGGALTVPGIKLSVGIKLCTEVLADA